jgi:hypothetical protein
VPAKRSWNLSLLAETELGRRNRRTVDAACLFLAAIVIGLTAVVASSAERQDEDVAQALHTVFASSETYRTESDTTTAKQTARGCRAGRRSS